MPRLGYPLFSSLSELGSHPRGLGHLNVALQMDRSDGRFDLSGGHVHRAYWMSIAYELFALIVDPVARIAGLEVWVKWMDSDGLTLTRSTGDLRVEAKDRYNRSIDRASHDRP